MVTEGVTPSLVPARKPSMRPARYCMCLPVDQDHLVQHGRRLAVVVAVLVS
jgi:hypothetical protein